MKDTISIDGAGRLVIPKRIRDRHGLVAGSALTITEEGDRIVLVPHTPTPSVVERDGRLVVDPGLDVVLDADHREDRDQRLRDLVTYALLR